MASGRKEYIFIWFIENYSYCWHKIGEALASPPFITYGLESTAWNLKVYPRGEIAEDKGLISLYRSKSDAGPESFSVKYELSALSADGSLLYSEADYDIFRRGRGFGFGQFLEMGEKFFQRRADYLPLDLLTVRCRIWKGEGSVQDIGRCFARTRIGIEKISFVQVVENFSSLEPNQKNTVWVQSHSSEEGFVSSSLYFTRKGGIIVDTTPSDNNHVLSKRNISLLDGSGNIIGCGEYNNRHDLVRMDIEKLSLSLTRQMIMNKKSDYLPDGKLCLLCECVFSTGQEFGKIEETTHGMPMVDAKLINIRTNKQSTSVYSAVKKASEHPSLSEDIKALYLSNCLTDVELKTKTKPFPAHKLVLCARSPVFKTMLTNEMREKHNNCIQIDDLGDDVVQQLLVFLYSDTTENMEWETATRLYYAADKYQVGSLKEVCSYFLLANLSPSNVGELLLLSDTHADTRLKESVEEFILENEEEVFGSDEWEMLLKTHPLLVAEAMHLKYKRKKMKLISN